MSCVATVVRRGRWPVFGLFLGGGLLVLGQLPARAAQSVTLTWNPSSATNVAGYNLYAGTTSRAYTVTNVAGAATNATIAGLIPGLTYYFAATTYDRTGNESAFSAEASYTVPLPPAALSDPARAGGQFSFLVADATGSQHVVQASTNLVNWVNLQTNAAPFTFVDTNAACFPQRYYRTYALTP